MPSSPTRPDVEVGSFVAAGVGSGPDIGLVGLAL